MQNFIKIEIGCYRGHTKERTFRSVIPKQEEACAWGPFVLAQPTFRGSSVRCHYCVYARLGYSLKPNFMKHGMLRKRLDNPKTETLQQSLETKFAQLGYKSRRVINQKFRRIREKQADYRCKYIITILKFNFNRSQTERHVTLSLTYVTDLYNLENVNKRILLNANGIKRQRLTTLIRVILLFVWKFLSNARMRTQRYYRYCQHPPLP